VVNRDLIKELNALEEKEKDFINKLLIIKTKKDIIRKMLKLHKKETC
tara:strand:+ start:11880 stop:12020 length:141 start_codon:yes stop_codon:yes gene_type:complete